MPEQREDRKNCGKENIKKQGSLNQYPRFFQNNIYLTKFEIFTLEESCKNFIKPANKMDTFVEHAKQTDTDYYEMYFLLK